jgi:hypothetical protein
MYSPVKQHHFSRNSSLGYAGHTDRVNGALRITVVCIQPIYVPLEALAM